MVHKKSEYRLQYHLLSKELRKQIWEDNVRARESRRSTNQADHYWVYQLTDDQCECEAREEEEEETVVLPPHKIKHRALLAQYGGERGQPGGGSVTTTPAAADTSISIPERSAEAWSEPAPDQPMARDRAVQTPDWDAQLDKENVQQKTEDKEEAKEKLKDDNATHSLRMPSSDVTKGPSGERHQVPSSRWREYPPPVVPPPPTLIHRQDPRGVGKPLASHRSDDTTRHPSPSRFSSLSRTSRKSYLEESKSKSPFVPYGWNESHTDVGDKKTYNVCAPKGEVHVQALKARNRRRADIERHLQQENERLRQIQTSKMAVNPGGMWMSEYQHQYSHAALHKGVDADRTCRPASVPVPVPRRPVSWRYS